ncbi:IPTL-CTERM sorting domain-containing protein [Lampropedia puyangensis]|uniref:IPTL-CTERM sorting domain-containing protein n=1 Tax=Lampropedia puyangensis TaxID=1330072 RepID=A0A4S8EZY1_9BURK|nr:IPTL-CTERM sorting domain-containing protein [Lampropedia puyangensis]THT99293.1 IPTL-CTERM sorting domain-containing protein [Lampropedia puyangensis]
MTIGPFASINHQLAGVRAAGALLLASCSFATPSAFAQDAFDCTASTNQLLVYCNDFEARVGGYTPSPVYRDMSPDPIATAYGGTEDKDAAATVNGVTGPAFIAQSWTVETLLLNEDNYSTSNASNKYSIGIQQNEGSPAGADSTGGDLVAFTFDAINPDTGDIAPFVELQVDFAPAFLTNFDGTDFRTAWPWGEAPRMKISLFDGQLTTDPGGAAVAHPDLDPAAVSGTPAPLSSQIITGGTPVAAVAPITSPVMVDFRRSTVRLSTAGITDPNGTVTLLMDVLADSTAPVDPNMAGVNFPRKYATFDNLKISVVKAIAPPASSPVAVPTMDIGGLGLLSTLAAVVGAACLRRRSKNMG